MILHWYYINLIQTNRYLEMSKQFDFIKKLILNDNQNNSLLLLKKINLRNSDERIRLIPTKTNELENSVVSYFRNAIKPETFSKTDYLIFENLSEKIKKKI